jgi:hypothetical protein
MNVFPGRKTYYCDGGNSYQVDLQIQFNAYYQNPGLVFIVDIDRLILRSI